VITPWAFGHFLLRSQGVFALPVGKDSTQRSVQFSGAGSHHASSRLRLCHMATKFTVTSLPAHRCNATAMR